MFQQSSIQSPNRQPPGGGWQNFLTGAVGYLLGSLAGIGFILLAYFTSLGGWLINLVHEGQDLLRILAIPLVAGLLLAIGGGILGALGGWSLGRILGTGKRAQVTAGSAVAFGIPTGLLILVYLLVISFFALYNNLVANRFDQFALLFGIFGLVFGLLLGILQGFLTLRVRHAWRIILAAIAGFTLGGLLMGALVRLVTTANLFKTSEILAWVVLLLALAIPVLFGGGAMGFAYGRLGQRMRHADQPVENALASRGQIIVVAVLGLLVTLPILGLLGNITNFLTINPGFVRSQIAPVTVGVAWSEPEILPVDALPVQFPAMDPTQSTAEATAPDGSVHRAWCSPEGKVQYQKDEESIETIDFPSCNQAPAIALDGGGTVHLVWYTQEIRDTNGVIRTSSLLVESIRQPQGWSEAVIAAQTSGEVAASMSGDPQGNLHLAWSEPTGNPAEMNYSVQENYQCNPDELTPLERAGLDVLLSLGTRPPGTDIPFCRNQFNQIVYTPNPDTAYSSGVVTPNGAFDKVAVLADRAQFEVLFTTMQWEENTSPPNPGSTLAESVASLYEAVKAHPEQFPRGMTVRILLGNYPIVSDFQWGSQIYAVISQMREAGVEKMVDPEIGWRLEIANYPGTYPHAHTKFLVIDGRHVLSVGFNYGYLHFPKDHPSGKGYDLFDLGLSITGPVAQEGIAAYDDLWSGANQITCEDFHPQDGSDWRDTCQEVKAVSDHVPEVLRTYLPPEGDSNSFSLFRTKDFKEGDHFIAASLATASQSIDAMEVNFSLEMICMANLLIPDLCTIDNALPWMDAMLESIERDQVRVRVIMENTNSNGLENRVAGKVLMDELERRGLDDLVELRFYNGKIHAKSILIDGSLLIIGSQNLHYSAWGEQGLAEYSLTTDDSAAISEYQAVFEAKWQEAIPFEEAQYGTTP
jgi:hypothetical protein